MGGGGTGQSSYKVPFYWGFGLWVRHMERIKRYEEEKTSEEKQDESTV